MAMNLSFVRKGASHFMPNRSTITSDIYNGSSIFDDILPSDLFLPDDNDEDFVDGVFIVGTNDSDIISGNKSCTITDDPNTCGSEDAIPTTRVFTDSDLWAENDHFALLNIPAMIFIGILLILGIVGNSLVVYIYGCRFKSTTQHFLIVCLACLDLLMSCIAMPTDIADLRFHHTFSSIAACKLLRFITMFSSTSSSFTLLTIAWDRHRRVTRPLSRQMTVRTARIWEALNLLAALIFSWPLVVMTGLRTSETRVPGLMGTDCSFSDRFHGSKWPLIYNCVLGLGFITMVIVLGALYFRIWKRARGQRVYMAGRRVGKGGTLSRTSAANDVEERDRSSLAANANVNGLPVAGVTRCGSRVSFKKQCSVDESRAHIYGPCAVNRSREDHSKNENCTESNIPVVHNYKLFNSNRSEVKTCSVGFEELHPDTLTEMKMFSDGAKNTPVSNLISISPDLHTLTTEPMTVCSFESNEKPRLSVCYSCDSVSIPAFKDVGHMRYPSNTSSLMCENSKDLPILNVSFSSPKSKRSSPKLSCSPVMRSKSFSSRPYNKSSVDSQCIRPMSSLYQSVTRSLQDLDLGMLPDFSPNLTKRILDNLIVDEESDKCTDALKDISSSKNVEGNDQKCQLSRQHGASEIQTRGANPVQHLEELTDSKSKYRYSEDDDKQIDEREYKAKAADVQLLESQQMSPESKFDKSSPTNCFHSDLLGTGEFAITKDSNNHEVQNCNNIIVGHTSNLKSHLKQSQIADGVVDNSPTVNCQEYRSRSFSSDSINSASSPTPLTNKVYNNSTQTNENKDITDNQACQPNSVIGKPRLSASKNIDKTTIVAFAVSIVFVVSFLPYLVLMFIRAFVKDFDYSLNDNTLWLYSLFLRFYLLNSAVNPLLYGWLNERFSAECKRLLLCRRSKFSVQR